MFKWALIVNIIFNFLINEISCYRLPTSISPHQYEISIITYLKEPDDTQFSFTGNVKIKINCSESTKNITLHSKDLEIAHDKINVKDLATQENAKVINQESDPKTDFYIIHLENPLKENNQYEIHIEFKGKLIDGLAGYYRSSYLDVETKNKHWLAVTQFEPTDARRAFPCFDEPGLKATFKINLGHRANLKSISNMPLLETREMKHKKEWVWNKFQESLPMSTYLVAYVVSDFDYLSSSKEYSNITFNIWARKDALNQIDFAKEVGPKALTFYEKFFDIEYPLPKEDMIAIPDFSAGAMENWGLITYREIYLLVDPEQSSASSKQKAASVIAHELAHQWFGNLVTMKWWTDLWLNEGFATYMASVALDNLFPQWNTLDEHAIQTLQQVYSLDALKSSHPISTTIQNPNEINQIFDTISYQKGSYLIRMMSLFLGDHILRKGVSNYLKENKYNNAEQDDLWEALTIQAHADGTLPINLTVKMIMDTWTLQTGYPIINVTRNYDDGTVKITQERYFQNKKEAQKESSQCWWIPLSYTTEEKRDFTEVEPKLWMSCPKSTQNITVPKSNSWLIFNIQASGLYRVNYDEKNWDMLISTLKQNKDAIPLLNRILLIDNALELAWTGRLNYNTPFKLLTYIKNENEYLPWRTVLTKLNGLANILKRTPSYGLFKTYMRALLKPIYKHLAGFKIIKEKSDSIDYIKHQVLINNAACVFGNQECIEEAVNQFYNWKNKRSESNPIAEDMKPTIYCMALKQGGEEEWDFLWEQYKTSNTGLEKNVILQALGCTREAWLLNRYLDWTIMNNTDIRTQDMLSVFMAVSSNDVGYFIAKTFFEANLKNIYNRHLPKVERLSSYVRQISKKLKNRYEQKEFLKFIMTNKRYFEKAKLGVLQALETTEINVQWLKDHYKEVDNILKNYVNEGYKQ